MVQNTAKKTTKHCKSKITNTLVKLQGKKHGRKIDSSNKTTIIANDKPNKRRNKSANKILNNNRNKNNNTIDAPNNTYLF